MALATNSYRRSALRIASKARPWTISTRTALLCVLVATMSVFMAMSLWLIWHQVRERGEREEETDLSQSIRSFGAAEAERYASLQRETALLAELPSLKALLTTNDDHTIQDAASTFWKTSGSSLFALADSNGRVRAIYGPPGADLSILSRDLSLTLPQDGKRYLVSHGRLFHYASSPVTFGDALHGAQLGIVVDGYEIDAGLLRQLSETSGTEAAFLSQGGLISASSPGAAFVGATKQALPSSGMARLSDREGKPFIAEARDLSLLANAPLEVIFQRSLVPAEKAAHAISRSILLIGASMLLIGSVLMTLVARQLTLPLENLTRRVQAFGEGAKHTRSNAKGTREIMLLEQNFADMELRVLELNRARLEGERLATIGSMATSVSHDLRHNLATIYAHAEFLMDADLSEGERDEFFENIKGAVLDTTEMLESLATFSRTGQAGRLSPESLNVVIGRAVSQVQLHPAAAKVTLETTPVSIDEIVDCDAKQIERALRNLLLNACQTRRPPGRCPTVLTQVRRANGCIQIQVRDNGQGVPKDVQESLFEPFVSAGKQDGTGLGLTLARRIAKDHGGSLTLVQTSSEETVFELTLPVSSQGETHIHEEQEVEV